MKAIKAALTLFALAFCIIIIVGIANVGKAVNHDQQTSDNVSAVWSQVHVGQSKSTVQAILGTPDDTTTMQMSNFNGGTDTQITWMYGTLGSTTYSVDFINGIVDSKSSI
jgi:hypothetical protein